MNAKVELTANSGTPVKAEKICNVAIEQAVLAALLTVDNSFEQVASRINEGCFYAQRHKYIFNAVYTLATKGQKYDAVMVNDYLFANELSEASGGEEYLMQILADAPSSFYNLASYVEKLCKYQQHREIESAGLRITELAKNLSVESVYQEAESILTNSAVGVVDTKKTSFSFDEAMDDLLATYAKKLENRANGVVSGVQFNLNALDAMVGTIQKGHLCVIGGRPGSGKSTLAKMATLKVAVRMQKPVLFVSAEMDTVTLCNGLISALSNGMVDYNSLHNGYCYDEGFTSHLANTTNQFRHLPIEIEDKQQPTIMEVKAWARKAKAKHGELGLIVVDYLQLICDPMYKDNRTQEIASISRQLKGMAKEFDCPVIALAQLNRGNQTGVVERRPVASDLKESGQIEQDADQIILVHRLVAKETGLNTGVTEMIVDKNRHGKKGIVPVGEDFAYSRFLDLIPDDVEYVDAPPLLNQ